MVKEKDYYKSKRSEYFSQFKEFCKHICALIKEKDGKKFKEEVMQEIREEYESIYEELPYIGGDRNPLTSDLIGAAENLAILYCFKKTW